MFARARTRAKRPRVHIHGSRERTGGTWTTRGPNVILFFHIPPLATWFCGFSLIQLSYQKIEAHPPFRIRRPATSCTRRGKARGNRSSFRVNRPRQLYGDFTDMCFCPLHPVQSQSILSSSATTRHSAHRDKPPEVVAPGRAPPPLPFLHERNKIKAIFPQPRATRSDTVRFRPPPGKTEVEAEKGG